VGVADPATAEGQVAPFIFDTEIQGPTFDKVFAWLCSLFFLSPCIFYQLSFSTVLLFYVIVWA